MGLGSKALTTAARENQPWHGVSSDAIWGKRTFGDAQQSEGGTVPFEGETFPVKLLCKVPARDNAHE